MRLIRQWLDDNSISYTFKEGYIAIPLELDCIWVNGFGQPMYYDKRISIHQNQYKKYIGYEVTGYSMGHTICRTGKQAEVIRILEERLQKS